MRRRYDHYRIFLGILLLFFIFSLIISSAQTIEEDINIKVKIDDNTNILNGEKGVEYSISKINIAWENTGFILNKDRSLNEITINAKNSENEDKEESYKFSCKGYSDNIYLNIKTYLDANKNEISYELQKHTLYTIHIPKGLLISKDGKKINDDIYFDFVTKGDSEKDILVSTSPANMQERVDVTENSIIFEFVDDIILNDILRSNVNLYKGYYINITSEKLSSNQLNYESDSIKDFDVYVEKNRLILKKNNGQKLKDLSKYTVQLKDRTLYLKNSSSGVKIYNESEDSTSQWTSFEFTTNKTVEITIPKNYEKNVKLEPTIKIKFRHYPKLPINTEDILKYVKLNIGGLNGEEIPLNTSNTEIYLDYYGKTLLITLKDSETNVKGLLRSNTSYALSIAEGAIPFNIVENMVNEKIVLNFTTGSSGESPNALLYSSSPSFTDDITSLSSTKLDSSGSIYVAFVEAIKFDKDFESDLKKEGLEAINKYFGLYEATTTLAEYEYSQYYNREIHIYNSHYIDTDGDKVEERYIFPEGITNVDELGDITKLESIPIKNVEILEYGNEDRILKITPKVSLNNLSKYKLRIDKAAIENSSGYNMDKDIEFSFWTQKSSDDLDVSWESVEGYEVDELKEDIPYFELPRYGEALPADDDSDIVEKIGERPIAIDVKGEIIPRAEEDLLESLKLIFLRDYYNYTDDGGFSYAGIEKIATEYYLKDGETYTKLYIYPSQLHYGRRYKLEIPSGTFESRSGNALTKLEFNFVVKSRSSEEMDILHLDNSQNDIENISKGAWEILVRGYNFTQKIDRAEILDIDSGKVVEITSEDIEFEDVTTIKVKIRDEKKDEFINKFGSISDELKLKIIIYFEGGASREKVGLTITPKGSPDPIEKDPSDMEIWYDENEINKRKIDGEYIYFLKVTFADIDIDGDGIGELNIKHTESSDGIKTYTGLLRLMEESSITASGSSVSLLNTDFIRKVIDIMEDENTSESEKNKYLGYIFEKNWNKKEAYLYIPIDLLSSQTTYNVTIASDVIVYSDSSQGNRAIIWSFTTMANPVATDIMIGSVGEDYDEDEPIIITGEFFYDTVEVYFNDIRAEAVKIKEDEDGATYLEVYLPEGGDRLEAGVYNIYIKNDGNHVRELYGAFSVVREGEWIPNEEYISSEIKLGEVRADIKISENTAVLKSKYADDKYLELNLDELMGINVLVRKVVIEGDEDDRIGILKTKSRWADIDLYNVKLDSNSDDEEIVLILGRADQALKQTLQKKLAGKSIKSEFIRATAENCKLDKIILRIPFEKSNGKNLKVLRYDEDTRNFYMERIAVNQVDKIVTVESKGKGIFVVIED